VAAALSLACSSNRHIYRSLSLFNSWKINLLICLYMYKTDCSNYRGISLLSHSYKILSNILLSRLTPNADEIIGVHQHGFRRNI
jgi:hypothetical protein